MAVSFLDGHAFLNYNFKNHSDEVFVFFPRTYSRQYAMRHKREFFGFLPQSLHGFVDVALKKIKDYNVGVVSCCGDIDNNLVSIVVSKRNKSLVFKNNKNLPLVLIFPSNLHKQLVRTIHHMCILYIGHHSVDVKPELVVERFSVVV